LSKWAPLLLVVTLFSAAAWADPRKPAGIKLPGVTGAIKDALGRPLANVELELSASDGRHIARTKSDQRGRFSFTNVAAGVYAVLARRTNFKPTTTMVRVGRTENKLEIYLEALQPLSMELTTRRLNQELNDLSPETGDSVYCFTARTITELPEGDNTSLPKVLIQAPGVTQDVSENGGFHVRGVDGKIQYRINGVMVPDINSAVAPVFNSRFAHSIALLDGTLPAQFGYRTAGVIDIHTKSGCIHGASHLHPLNNPSSNELIAEYA
jgi:hypothetical protein